MKLLILISLLFLFSCGKSPLLTPVEYGVIKGNHAQEVNLKFNSTSQEITIKWLTNTNTNEEAKALIILTKNGSITDPDNFNLNAFLWMKSMGHGSSPIVVKKIAPGIYQLEEIYFSMSGDWQLHLTLNSSTTKIEDLEYSMYINE